jgi:triosephosphate isomerase
VIAYEPVWAIGTGKNCSPEETISSISLIRNILAKMYNRELANEVRIIYGGSVNYENSGSYTKLSEINGLLVGGTSLKADEFIKIIESKNG